MIALGVGLGMKVKEQWMSGLWLGFIGWFLLNAAQESVAQVAIRETLSGLHAADVMSHEVPTVPRDISLEDYGQEVARTGRRCHLVNPNHRPVGMSQIHEPTSFPPPTRAHMSLQHLIIHR